MEVILSGSVDGQLQSLYQKIQQTQNNPAWVLSTGSFGLWPDPARIDRGTRKSVGAGEFGKLYLEQWEPPYQTLFVPGPHEDHLWLQNRFKSNNLEILPNLYVLPNGAKTTIGDAGTSVRVTGFGKVYSESTFQGKFNKKSRRHYTRNEFERACSSGPTDILLLHEAPNIMIKRIIFATRPKLIVYSTRASTVQTTIMGVNAVGLAKGDIYSIVL